MASDIKDSEAFQAIGEFIYKFSQLEFTLRYFLACELKLDDELANAVMAQFDFARLCATSRAIVDQSSKYSVDEKVRFRKLLDGCNKLNDERVKIVHATWDIGLGSMAALHVSRSTLKPNFHYRKLEEVRDKSRLAQDLFNHLVDLMI